MKILVFGGDSDIAREICVMEKGTILINHRKCDVSKQGSADHFIRTYKPEVVINCAGILKVESVKEQGFADWKDIININLFGSFNVAQASVKNNVKTINI